MHIHRYCNVKCTLAAPSSADVCCSGFKRPLRVSEPSYCFDFLTTCEQLASVSSCVFGFPYVRPLITWFIQVWSKYVSTLSDDRLIGSEQPQKYVRRQTGYEVQQHDSQCYQEASLIISDWIQHKQLKVRRTTLVMSEGACGATHM